MTKIIIEALPIIHYPIAMSELQFTWPTHVQLIEFN